jgi:hypothetical protein
MTDIKQKIEQFKRQLLEDLMAECTPPQLELFGKCFPDGVPSEKLTMALELCDRTVKKNREESR